MIRFYQNNHRWVQRVKKSEMSRAAGTSPAVSLMLCQLSEKGLTWAKTQLTRAGHTMNSKAITASSRQIKINK